MKKTVQVNLSGQVFTLDEDAYDLLSGYLRKIGRLYEHSAGKDEILSDIESRIAELLLERNSDRKEVITIADVQAVTEIMGNPEEFEDGEYEAEERSAYSSSRSDYSQKRLFRDPDHPIIGGVCSGIGYYFGLNPLWIRLVFGLTFIFFGSGLLLYILLWIIIPQAKTASDKLNMKGEPINIDSIGKTIEEEISHLGERLSSEGRKFSHGSGRKIERGIDKFFNFLAELFRGFFTVLGKILGGLFVLIGISIVVVMIVGIVGIADVIHLSSHGWDSSFSVYEMGDLVFNSGEWLVMAITGSMLLIGIPFIALAYGGLTLLFPSLRVPYLGASFAGLWFLGIILAIMTAFGVSHEFSKEETITDTVNIAALGIVSDTIALEVGHDPFNISPSRAYYASNDFMMRIEDHRIMVGNVSFDIRQSKDDDTYLEMRRTAKAGSYEEAGNRADSIRYTFITDSNKITFDPYFTFPEEQLLRAQEVKLTLRLPIGTTVYMSEEMKRIIDDIDNVDNMHDPNMVNHHWRMTEKGLECTDCETDRDGDVSDEDEHYTIDVDIVRS